mmetsp:Transcript_56627/g.168520  ORF Transcript_56627/g.168520 Transcript_56627/m.168520 type:complete len:417 (-) Transcript_56627:155-1405(-)
MVPGDLLLRGHPRGEAQPARTAVARRVPDDRRDAPADVLGVGLRDVAEGPRAREGSGVRVVHVQPDPRQGDAAHGEADQWGDVREDLREHERVPHLLGVEGAALGHGLDGAGDRVPRDAHHQEDGGLPGEVLAAVEVLVVPQRNGPDHGRAVRDEDLRHGAESLEDLLQDLGVPLLQVLMDAVEEEELGEPQSEETQQVGPSAPLGARAEVRRVLEGAVEEAHQERRQVDALGRLEDHRDPSPQEPHAASELLALPPVLPVEDREESVRDDVGPPDHEEQNVVPGEAREPPVPRRVCRAEDAAVERAPDAGEDPWDEALQVGVGASVCRVLRWVRHQVITAERSQQKYRDRVLQDANRSVVPAEERETGAQRQQVVRHESNSEQGERQHEEVERDHVDAAVGPQGNIQERPFQPCP